jgi:hypothetical protein
VLRFVLGVLGLDLAVLLLEALNAAGSIDELLLPRKERMAVVANFNAERIFGCGRTGSKLVTAAGTVYKHCVIIGMNAFFHDFPLKPTDFAVIVLEPQKTPLSGCSFL